LQLDNTRIAIQERGILEVMDLALQVTRAYAKPLIQTSLLMIIPLMIINQLLLGWLLEPVAFESTWSGEEASRVFRYVLNMALLITIEAPLASILATAYLGQAVFLERPKIGQLLKDVAKLAPAIVLNLMFLRGVVPAWVMAAMIDRYAEYSGWEVMLMLLAVLTIGLRAFRPFITEIIVLERLPVRPSTTGMSIGRRSSLLHSPASGDLFARSFVVAGIACMLTLGTYGVFLFCSGIILNQWQTTPLLLQLFLPASMWIAASFLQVVRFLSYLDLRIRHEGWEVELRLRAEATRLAGKLV
jgi:hypothetical protein